MLLLAPVGRRRTMGRSRPAPSSRSVSVWPPSRPSWRWVLHGGCRSRRNDPGRPETYLLLPGDVAAPADREVQAGVGQDGDGAEKAPEEDDRLEHREQGHGRERGDDEEERDARPP